MGNPHQNSIPFCQLQHLFHCITTMSKEEMDESVDDMKAATKNLAYSTIGEKNTHRVFGRVGRLASKGGSKVADAYRKWSGDSEAIWLDTLCVPLDNTHRKVAIGGMKDVYAKASTTLVIDSEIRMFSHKGCPDEEIAVRLGLTGWMRRAWTFQEGVLACNRLRFLFSDGAARLPLWKDEVDYMDTMPDMAIPTFINGLDKFRGIVVDFSVKQGLDPYLEDTDVPQKVREEREREARVVSMRAYTLTQSKRFFQAMRTMWGFASAWSPPRVLIPRIMAVWNDMRVRETSREADKFLCFAMSCAQGSGQRQLVENLLALPAEQRMKGWAQAQSVVPSEFLFIPGERYQDLGFKWLPNGVHRVVMEDPGEGVRDKDDGLLVFEKQGSSSWTCLLTAWRLMSLSSSCPRTTGRRCCTRSRCWTRGGRVPSMVRGRG